MTKIFSAVGFCAGLLILGLAYFNAPGAGPVEARERGRVCGVIEVAVDAGYGISQVELRKVCAAAR